jgi:hypothetical protein
VVAEPSAIVHCHFYLRRSQPNGGRPVYEPLRIDGWEQSGALTTWHAPQRWDLIYLKVRNSALDGVYRVLERSWRQPAYGSVYWPHDKQMPTTGPALDLIVEAADGLFDDEAPPAPENIPAFRAEDYQISALHQIGLGGDGLDRRTPECGICWARGGGGHGGFCPNSGKPHSQWITVAPAGYLSPPYPRERTPWN